MFFQIFYRNFFRTQATDQIYMYHRNLSCIFYSLYDPVYRTDISKQYKNHLYLLYRATYFYILHVLHSCNNRIIADRIVKYLIHLIPSSFLFAERLCYIFILLYSEIIFKKKSATKSNRVITCIRSPISAPLFNCAYYITVHNFFQ